MGIAPGISLILYQFHLPVLKILIERPEGFPLRIGQLQLFGEVYLPLLVKFFDLLFGLGQSGLLKWQTSRNRMARVYMQILVFHDHIVFFLFKYKIHFHIIDGQVFNGLMRQRLPPHPVLLVFFIQKLIQVAVIIKNLHLFQHGQISE